MPHAQTNAESNKRLIMEYVSAFNRQDYDHLRQLFAQNALVQGVLGKGGIEVVIPLWQELQTGLGPQLHVEEMVAEGDAVAVRYTERGLFHGPFRGQAPTGLPYEVPAMEWFIIHDGKIIQRWGLRDGLSIARQTGLPLT